MMNKTDFIAKWWWDIWEQTVICHSNVYRKSSHREKDKVGEQ